MSCLSAVRESGGKECNCKREKEIKQSPKRIENGQKKRSESWRIKDVIEKARQGRTEAQCCAKIETVDSWPFKSYWGNCTYSVVLIPVSARDSTPFSVVPTVGPSIISSIRLSVGLSVHQSLFPSVPLSVCHILISNLFGYFLVKCVVSEIRFVIFIDLVGQLVGQSVGSKKGRYEGKEEGR